MSAAGAIITSARSASASIFLPGSESPDSTAAWLTEPVSDVGGAERERRRDTRRRPEPARRADPDRPGIAVTRRQLVAQREDRGQQRDQRPVVGVPAAVGLDGDVLGDGQASRQLGLLLREQPALDQRAEHLARRRRHELRRDLGAGDLREDVVPPHDRARPGVASEPGRRAAHHGGREAHERRGADPGDAAAQEQVRHPLLERGLVGRVDEVHAPGGAIPERALDLVDRPLDALEGEAGGAEEAEQLGLRHGDHHPRRGDAVGHLPDDVREAHAVHFRRTSDRRATRGTARAASPAADDRRPGAVCGGTNSPPSPSPTAPLAPSRTTCTGSRTRVSAAASPRASHAGPAAAAALQLPMPGRDAMVDGEIMALRLRSM